MISLKTLEPSDDREIPKFAVCDIESANWIDFLVIGLAWKEYDEDEIVKKQTYKHFLTMREFCDFVFSKDQPQENIFAHFGGRFDFNFVLREYFLMRDKYFIGEMIPRGSGLLCFEVSSFERLNQLPDNYAKKDLIGRDEQGRYLMKVRTITFRDSSAMLPFGLGSLTENFGVDHKKKEIDYEAITKVDDELLEYLEYDCWGLYEVIERYFKWPMIKSAGASFTVASQALRVFRTFLKQEISSLSPRVDEFVRSSYFGGRTEIFRPFFEQSEPKQLLKSFDVNSLYPAVMRDFSVPTSFHFETDQYLDDRMGFYDVDVFVPDMYVPPLGVRYNNLEDKLIFPTGKFRGIWSSCDLNHALSVGCKILKVHKGLIFKDGGPIFREYVEYLYQIRKNSDKASVSNVLAKLLMNSTYGRTGLNLQREQLVFDDGSEGLTPYVDIPLDRDEKEILRIMTKQSNLDSSFSNVAIAAWITSQARVWMHKLYLKAPEHIFYTDTDSIKTTYDYACNDDELGQLKLEYSTKRACFILPKTYIEETMIPMFKTYDEKGREKKGEKSRIKIVMKGFDKRKISKFTTDDFVSALEGDLRRLRAMNPAKFATLKTAISKNKFLALIKESPKQIRSRYYKRRIFKRDYSQIYDTEPLHIKNGDIVNLDVDILKKWKNAQVDVEQITNDLVMSYAKDRQIQDI